jgi:hypothetical protein
MNRPLRTTWLFIGNYSTLSFLVATSLIACRHAHGSNSLSSVPSATNANGNGVIVVDWPCAPRRFGISAETTVNHQEEYCEWKVEQSSDKETVCRFTSSFDNRRDFYLNSRGQTLFNTITAAQDLRDACMATTLLRLANNQSPGEQCSDISPDDCIPTRFSDPEICEKIRWVTTQNFNKLLNFTIEDMPKESTELSPSPLMRFGLGGGLPPGCHYSQLDQTEVQCVVPTGTPCLTVAGRLKVGLRVLTTPYSGPMTATLPASDDSTSKVIATSNESGPTAPSESSAIMAH